MQLNFNKADWIVLESENSMLYIIGLGLGDERDITIRGLDAIKKCSKVYVEAYTSLLSFGISSNGVSTLVTLSFSLIVVFRYFWIVFLGRLIWGGIGTIKL